MKIVALLTVYNEELYLRRCLRHLREQGVDVCLIDNGSTDRSREIAESFLDDGVIRIESLPRRGLFELEPLLIREEELAEDIGADWYLHHDADEIRQAPNPFRTLREGIEAADRAGCNAINFDEFVFVPTGDSEDYTSDRYPDEMGYYYFFEPSTERRVNAWKNPGQRVDLHSSGGHSVTFPERKVYGENFILRHYMALSLPHLIRKYCGRVVSEEERTTRGWNNARVSLRPDRLHLPDRGRLKSVSSDNTWDRSDPWKTHAIFEHSAPLPRQRPDPDEGAAVSRSPILFIVGVEGSGTDALRGILDRHPDLSVRRETSSIMELRDELGDRGDSAASFLESIALRVSRDVADTLKERISRCEKFTFSEGVRELYRLQCESEGKSRYGVEAPGSVAEMERVRSVLPEVRFVHVIRDGRELAAGSSAGISTRDAQQAASEWIWTIVQARRQAQNLPYYLEVRFEELRTRPSVMVDAVCSYLELPEREMHLTDSHCAEQSREIEMDGHAHSLPPKERERFEAVAGGMLAELGYQVGE